LKKIYNVDILHKHTYTLITGGCVMTKDLGDVERLKYELTMIKNNCNCVLRQLKEANK